MTTSTKRTPLFTKLQKLRIRRMGIHEFLTEHLRQGIVQELHKEEQRFWGTLPETGFLEEGC